MATSGAYLKAHAVRSRRLYPTDHSRPSIAGVAQTLDRLLGPLLRHTEQKAAGSLRVEEEIESGGVEPGRDRKTAAPELVLRVERTSQPPANELQRTGQHR